MINRRNLNLVNTFIKDSKSNLLAKNSISEVRAALIKFISFLGDTPVEQSKEQVQSYKNFLINGTSRVDGKNKPLSTQYVRKLLAYAREFLEWIGVTKDIREFNGPWLKNQLSLSQKEQNIGKQNNEIDWFSVDEVSMIASTPATTLVERRIQAALALMFLTGIRISAFLSLPLAAVDLKNMSVYQDAAHGVNTKLSKSAISPILPLIEQPRLLAIIVEWDGFVRSELPPEGKWFPNIDAFTGEFSKDPKVGAHRDSGFRKDMAEFLKKAGLGYKKPHLLRHGFIRIWKDEILTFADAEALSGGLLQTITTFLSLYGRMKPDQQRKQVNAMVERRNNKLMGNAHLSQGIPDPETITWVLEYIKNNLGGFNAQKF